jgi:ABC-type nickel/cobalt efflux system permease component RcnA
MHGKPHSKMCAARPLRVLFSLFAAIGLLFFPPFVAAHPMGNFSISHYSGITIGRDFVEVRYWIDMAEIPTFQEMQQNSIEARREDSRLPVYLSAQAANFGQNLHVMLNGHALPLQVVSQDVIFPPGAGNLPTMKFGFVYRAEINADCTIEPCRLEYDDANFPGRAGWKEVVVTPGHEISLIRSTAPEGDRSQQLSNYPTDLLSSPPQQLQVSIIFSGAQTQTATVASHNTGNSDSISRRSSTIRDVKNHNKVKRAAQETSAKVLPGGEASPKIELKPNQQGTPRNAFTELMAQTQFGLGILLLSALIAAGLGALHALEPGHGKTIVAAYLVGSRGTARHALLLGMVVTISHTAGVYLLGGVTLYAQKYILPDRIYPFLGVLSGILIAGMGCFLFLQRYLGGQFAHSHATDTCDGAQMTATGGPQRRGQVSARQLLVLGATGGMVPCPAALVVLLSAVALHRTGFGLYLIVAFSVGLAAVLITMGFVAVYAGRMMSRLPFEAPLIQRWLPMASAVMISALGCGIAARGLMAAGILHIRI